jgi:exonuclease VII small subunit
MTDALKTVLLEMFSEIPTWRDYAHKDAEWLASALTRRGVVVQGDGEREALEGLGAALGLSRETYSSHARHNLDAAINDLQRNGMSLDRVCMNTLVRVRNQIAKAETIIEPLLKQSATAPEPAQPTPPSSDVEAVAPVRKVVNENDWDRAYDFIQGDAINPEAFYNRMKALGPRPIPQPGAEP